MAKEYTKRVGFDFQETFSPTSKHTIVSTFLALAVINGWFLSQFDINSAILNGNFHEYVYMKIPLSFEVRESMGTSQF